MFGLGFWELTLILAIILLLFGGSKLPGLGRGLGKAIKDFRGSLSESGEDASRKDENKKDKS
ncbi:twin-arginine translocase TatA/TatE family subunit [Fundidesulfovibrio terrae]|uniref:twin-arginine translocase TatA/TatE family subunit n=1 Tax=Fundidesulfovibrio terrae TaxID=2922866 RepID=UPI001FAEE2B1|nr:twin-arginine translocase TatA/TatE family subunit [Fundidesulfovibrio terrae]